MMHQKSILFLILLFYFGCNKSTGSKNIYGCTISSACNFNAAATIFDDSCINEFDCWGECGTADIDECGVCGGDGILSGKCDCVGNILDCAGVCGGSAVNLGCGCGVADPSGCDNQCGSIAELDECGVCGGEQNDGDIDNNDEICETSCDVELDCWGECGGSAVVDICGVCDGNGISEGKCDCAGNIVDCADECGGSAVDLGCGCGISDQSGCDNQCGSITELDECGVCGGDGSSCPKIMLSVSPTNISVGQSTTLEVNLANIQNLYALSFEILFSHSILEIDMESGNLNYDQFTGDNFGPVVYFDDGIVSFVLGGNNIDGNIFSVNITGLQTGTTNVTLDKVILKQEDGKDVFSLSSLILENVEITVTLE